MNSHTPTTWWVILRHKGKKQTKKHTVSPYQRKKSVERRRCVCMLVWTRRTGLPWLRTCNMTVPLCRASSHVKTLKSTSSRKSFLPDVTVRPKDMIPTNACQEQPRLPLRFLFFLPLAKSLRRCMMAATSQSTEAYAWGMVVFDCVSLWAITRRTFEAGISVKVPWGRQVGRRRLISEWGGEKKGNLSRDIRGEKSDSQEYLSCHQSLNKCRALNKIKLLLTSLLQWVNDWLGQNKNVSVWLFTDPVVDVNRS